jgi:hypothetical protein
LNDLTPPETTLVSGPDAVTGDTTARFVFGSNEEATFECSLDGATFTACPEAITGVTEGPHTMRARAIDAAGNVDPTPLEVTWTINVTDPAPTISDVGNQTTAEDTAIGPIAFTIGDPNNPADSLTVTATSSDGAVVAPAGIALAGSGANRTVTLRPVGDASGTTTITVTVSDGSLTASDTFVLTVTAVNDPPFISDIPNQTTIVGNAVTAAFTVADVESGAAPLTLAGSSSNTAIVPNAGITFGGSGAARTVTVTPGQTVGSSVITVTVSDPQGATSSDTFTVQVTPFLVTITAGVNPAGSGTATVTAGGCSASTCTVAEGTPVTIGEAPGQAFGFSQWSGATCPGAGGFGSSFTFTATRSNVSCTAGFFGLWGRSYGGTNLDLFLGMAQVGNALVVVGITEPGPDASVFGGELDPATGTIANPYLTFLSETFHYGQNVFPISATRYVFLGVTPTAGVVYENGLGQLIANGGVQVNLFGEMPRALARNGAITFVGTGPGPNNGFAHIATLDASYAPLDQVLFCDRTSAGVCGGSCIPTTIAAMQSMSDDGGVLVVSTRPANNQIGIDLLRLSSNLVREWSMTIEGTGQDFEAFGVTATDPSNVLVLGRYRNGAGRQAGLAIAIDARNPPAVRWIRALSLPNLDVSAATATPHRLGWGVIGTINPAPGQGTDGVLAVLAPDGTVRSGASFGGAGVDVTTVIVAPANGGFVIAGGSNTVAANLHGETGSYDAFAFRTDDSGRITFDTARTGLTRTAATFTASPPASVLITTTCAPGSDGESADTSPFPSQSSNIPSRQDNLLP